MNDTLLLAGQSEDHTGPVFREPWEAQAFAMTLVLHQRGLFGWPEWTEALAAQMAVGQAAGDAGLGDTYYRQWLAALENLVVTKSAASLGELIAFRRAWSRAAKRTPHGQPIDLEAVDFES